MMRLRLFVLLLLLLSAAPAAAFAESGCCSSDCCCLAESGETTGELEVVIFHLPLAFNDGSPVPQELLDDLLAAVTELAGGFTYYEATGGWLHEGRLYRESVWVVKVGIAEAKQCELQKLVETRLKEDFGQLAVWLESEGSAEIR